MRLLHRAFVALMLVSSVVRAQEEPPRRLDLSTAPASQRDTTGPRWGSSRELRARFVRDQTILGLTVYGPAFATMVGRDGVTGTAGYLVMAGGTFFASAELTRRVRITEARSLMSSAMGIRGAGSALLITTQSDMEVRPAAGVVLLGALAGTASGLYFGGGLTGGEAAATVMGHDLAMGTAVALTFAGDADPFDADGVDPMTSAVAWTAAGLGGYFGGRWYAGIAKHNLTVGDLQTLWTGATIGALAGGATIASGSPSNEVVAPTLLAGAWLGVILTERTLVRRYDHTRGEANLVALGGGAGALMGMGVGILIAGEADRGGSLTLGFATAGAVAGVAMSERYLQPDRDSGRLAWLERVRIAPGALAAAATGAPGRHTLLSFTF
jgi:hypothetical protein